MFIHVDFSLLARFFSSFIKIYALVLQFDHSGSVTEKWIEKFRSAQRFDVVADNDNFYDL